MPLGAFRINSLAKVQAVAAPGLRTTGFMNVIANGDAQLSNAQYKFRTGTRGGSIYMDGTGDYLYASDNASNNLDFGTDDFTIEWFQYKPTLDLSAVDLRNGSNGSKILLYSNPSNSWKLWVNSAIRIDSGAVLSANTWQHICLCRESGNTRLYVDGTQRGSTYSDSTNYQHDSIHIFYNTLSTAYDGQGYIDEFRISDVARYTGASLTVPTAAFEPDANTRLLLHGDGPYGSTGNFHIVDDIGDLRPLDIHIQANVSQGGTAPSISTAQSKFGGSSFSSYDNEGHCEFVTPAFGSQFTIEFWFRADSVSGTQHLTGVWGGTPHGGFTWMIRLSGSSLQASVWDGSTMILNNVNMGTGVTANTWHHAAITWDGSTYRTFYNGTMGATLSNSTPPNYEKWSTTWVGTVGGTLDNFSGYIDEYRISDTARYTASFSTQSTAFTNDANTQVLLHFDGTNGATTTTDDAS